MRFHDGIAVAFGAIIVPQASVKQQLREMLASLNKDEKAIAIVDVG
jgi:hypothetical protein